MQCPHCKVENRGDRRFCGSCGGPLTRACPACAFSNEPESKFCGGCGALLNAGPAPPASPAFATPQDYTPPYLAQRILSDRATLEGERKQVTIFFADLKGSMELLADRDPEEARRILDPVLERMISAVHHYEGTVNQVMGDGIMALFGAPVAHEDHAVRAGYAALRMQRTIGEFARDHAVNHGVKIQIRVGLNSGEVVVRGIGNDLNMDYSAVGQSTHLAARMEQLAPPGSIYATEAFARLTEGYLHFKPLGLQSVRGLADPVDIFELIDAEPTRSRFQAAPGRGLTRFVGREGEISAFHRSLERALGGRGQAVAVIGDPGVGKSRLFYEFLDSEPTRGWIRLETGSVSYGKVNAFQPLRDLVRLYCQIEDRDEAEKVEEKLAGRILALDPGLGATLPALRSLLETPVGEPEWESLEPSRRRQRMLDAVKQLLVRQSQIQPLLLVFENLHWIDGQTQAFLDSLIDSLPGARILLLVNYRPEYRHTWGNKTYYTQLRLNPLPREGAEELLSFLLGDEAELEPLKRHLIERTDGNPFFLEESVRQLVELKVLGGGRGRRCLLKADAALQVPPTVQAILAARIDRLSAAEKRLLQSAAVIGRNVSMTLLRTVTEMSEPEVREGLSHLQSAEFLYETSLFPELEYTFKHALTQDVAYGSLLRERRRALHATIVGAIESLYADRLPSEVDRLAHHALQGGLWDKAVGYYRQAAHKAAMRSGFRDAVDCYDKALGALRNLPDTAETLHEAFDLRMGLRTWLVPLGDYDRILANLTQAEQIAQELGDRRGLGLIRAYMTDYFRLTGESEQAIVSGEEALAYAHELGDFSLEILSNMVLGHAYHAVGNYRRAVEVLRRNVDSIQGDHMRERFGSAGLPAVMSRGYMALSLADLGEFAEARRMGEEGARLAEELDTEHSHAVACHAVGIGLVLKGDLDEALPLLEETLRRCQAHNIPIGSRLLYSAIGYAYIVSGRLREAVPLLEQAVREAETLKVVFRYSLWLAWLGEAHLLGGSLENATRLAAQALDRATAHKEVGHEAYALRLIGEIAVRRIPPDLPSAETAFQRALELAVQLGMRPLEAHCRVALADLHRKAGRESQASAELLAAADLYRTMGMTYWLGRMSDLPAPKSV